MPNNNPQGNNQYQDDSNPQRKPSGERQQEQSTGSPGNRQQGQQDRSSPQTGNQASRQQGESSSSNQRSSKNQH
ncbi:MULTISPECIES: hypothetical protein [unclassified Acidovorax]|uniref:hypothetical protein n=1 Tax=unclassified Acidovorax TaxID=2684926 RepID=UPI000709F394|nr:MULTISPECIES: hypothetical protein [unclassified Acidovorax]KRC28255.1 hypothetical protein ASE28_02515 [Acidovorax sp. Root219]KRC28448.1 hypothetical protein ASE31_12880 [Acidovorax sp. Root217]